MIGIFATTWPVFLGVTLVLFGGAGWMTGQALAQTWRPQWHLLPYGLLLAAGDRLFASALFHDALLSWPDYLLALVVVLLSGALAFRVRRAQKMVAQYPWLYERAGPFGWRDRQG